MRDFSSRGGWWVLAQGVVFVAVAVAVVAGRDPDPPSGLVWAGVVVASSGGVLAADGLVRIRRHATAMPAPVAGAPLIEKGSFGLVRHPIYGGLVIAVSGIALATVSWPGGLGAVVLLAFFDRKSRFEEELLEAAYEHYAGYRARVPRRLIPYVL